VKHEYCLAIRVTPECIGEITAIDQLELGIDYRLIFVRHRRFPGSTVGVSLTPGIAGHLESAQRSRNGSKDAVTIAARHASSRAVNQLPKTVPERPWVTSNSRGVRPPVRSAMPVA